MFQFISYRLQLVSMLSLGIGPVATIWHVLFHKFLEHMCLWGTSSNFLVLRVEAHKTSQSSQLWQRGPERGAFLVLLTISFFFYKILFIDFQRGEGREKERETSMCGCLAGPTPHQHWGFGQQPSPDWESKGNSLVGRPALNSLRHISQGTNHFLICPLAF